MILNLWLVSNPFISVQAARRRYGLAWNRWFALQRHLEVPLRSWDPGTVRSVVRSVMRSVVCLFSQLSQLCLKGFFDPEIWWWIWLMMINDRVLDMIKNTLQCAFFEASQASSISRQSHMGVIWGNPWKPWDASASSLDANGDGPQKGAFLKWRTPNGGPQNHWFPRSTWLWIMWGSAIWGNPHILRSTMARFAVLSAEAYEWVFTADPDQPLWFFNTWRDQIPTTDPGELQAPHNNPIW